MNKSNLKQKLIPVFRPNYTNEEVNFLSKVLKSGWIGLGPKTEEFEMLFANYLGASHAVAVNSATAALHLALIVAGVKENDEVIIPSLTFVSTAHVIRYLNATPIFADIEEDTLCISPKDVEKKITKKTRAIIPVHYGGHPCDMDKLQKIAKKHGLTIIEDASHACGSVYKKRKIGSISPITCFSFHAVKNLATGDGGMITVRDGKTAQRLKRLRWMGINKDTWDRLEDISEGENKSFRIYGWHYEINEIGYKYHMNDINAALGIVQLRKLEASNKKRRKLAERYTKYLGRIPQIKCPVLKANILSAQHNYVIRTKDRDKLHIFLRDRNISSGVHYMPLHLQPYYRKLYPRVKLPIVEREWRKLLTLPLYPDLTLKDQDYIISTIRKFYER